MGMIRNIKVATKAKQVKESVLFDEEPQVSITVVCIMKGINIVSLTFYEPEILISHLRIQEILSLLHELHKAKYEFIKSIKRFLILLDFIQYITGF